VGRDIAGPADARVPQGGLGVVCLTGARLLGQLEPRPCCGAVRVALVCVHPSHGAQGVE